MSSRVAAAVWKLVQVNMPLGEGRTQDASSALTVVKLIQVYPKLPDKITVELELNRSLQVKRLVSSFVL